MLRGRSRSLSAHRVANLYVVATVQEATLQRRRRRRQDGTNTNRKEPSQIITTRLARSLELGTGTNDAQKSAATTMTTTGARTAEQLNFSWKSLASPGNLSLPFNLYVDKMPLILTVMSFAEHQSVKWPIEHNVDLVAVWWRDIRVRGHNVHGCVVFSPPSGNLPSCDSSRT